MPRMNRYPVISVGDDKAKANRLADEISAAHLSGVSNTIVVDNGFEFWILLEGPILLDWDLRYDLEQLLKEKGVILYDA